jgi:hypothetical protein
VVKQLQDIASNAGPDDDYGEIGRMTDAVMPHANLGTDALGIYRDYHAVVRQLDKNASTNAFTSWFIDKMNADMDVAARLPYMAATLSALDDILRSGEAAEVSGRTITPEMMRSGTRQTLELYRKRQKASDQLLAGVGGSVTTNPNQ